MCPWISVHPLLAAALTGAAAPALAGEKTNWPNYREGDFVIADYTIASTETLPPRQDISRGTESLQTHRWREADSNPRSPGHGELRYRPCRTVGCEG